MCWIIKKNNGGTELNDKIDSYYWNYYKAQEQYSLEN